MAFCVVPAEVLSGFQQKYQSMLMEHHEKFHGQSLGSVAVFWTSAPWHRLCRATTGLAGWCIWMFLCDRVLMQQVDASRFGSFWAVGPRLRSRGIQIDGVRMKSWI